MNDIVAEFASSKSSRSVLKQYHIVAGSVFSDEYNETLDSAVLVLDHVPVEDRLINLQPYEYVHVFDTNNPSNFDRIYLVDNFSEQEKNINEHLFSYTINLMSETKFLEKIQCPNLTITHGLKEGSLEKLTIYEHIKRYIELYSPVYKEYTGGNVESWHYAKIITVPGTGTDFYNKFNVPSADLGFSMPTLRQLLTTLMQQVGCIPTLHKGVLGYLDFKKEPVDFSRGETPDYTADYTVSRIQRSLSSDSYANTLVNISDNVLDSGNTVICERLGFRDKNNILLKQTENLYLNTNFPIYNVESFKMNALGSINNVHNVVTTDIVDFDNVGFGSFVPHVSLTISGNDIILEGEWARNSYATQNKCYGIHFHVKFVFYDSQLRYVDEYNINDVSYTPNLDVSQPSGKIDVELTFTNAKTTSSFAYIAAKITVTQVVSYEYHEPSPGQDDYWDVKQRYYIKDTCSTLNYYNPSGARVAPPINGIPWIVSFDITPLIKEASIRQNLETNYLKMNSESIVVINNYSETIANLSKYRYGTVQFDIGSKIIKGFSDVYTVAYAHLFGPVYKNITYIENIFNTLQRALPKQNIVDDILASTTILVDAQMFDSLDIIPYAGGDHISFAGFTFDIKYQPLNSFNLSFAKQNKDIPIAIEQLDANASALTDFDRLVLHEQETVDRIGNEVLSISQRVNNLSDIRGTDQQGNFVPVKFREDKNRDQDWEDNGENREYILFKRQISVNDYYYDISYTGMENAILKDYFTSIRTKYRAYENVDYNQSVLRKERDTIYVFLGSKFFDDSDNIHFPFYNSRSAFIDGFTYYPHNQTFFDSNNLLYTDNLKYICEIGRSNEPYDLNDDAINIVKNEMSIITSKDILGIVYENVDNAGAGTYVSSSKYTTFYTSPNYTNNNPESSDAVNSVKIGGVPQSWQIWKTSFSNPSLEVYAKQHHVIFMGDINFVPESHEIIDIDDTTITAMLNRTAVLPMVNITGSTFGSRSPWSMTSPQSKKFVIGKKQTGDTLLANHQEVQTSWVRLFYKDYAERINHTIQFVYYTDMPENIAWTELFIENSSLIQKAGNQNKNSMCLIFQTDPDAELNTNPEWHQAPIGSSQVLYGYMEDHGDNYENYVRLGSVSPSHQYIRVVWHQYSVITVALFTVISGEGRFKDVISFKKPKDAGASTIFYLSFNDTKSDKVLRRNNDGVLYEYATVTSGGRRTDADSPFNPQNPGESLEQS